MAEAAVETLVPPVGVASWVKETSPRMVSTAVACEKTVEMERTNAKSVNSFFIAPILL